MMGFAEGKTFRDENYVLKMVSTIKKTRYFVNTKINIAYH